MCIRDSPGGGWCPDAARLMLFGDETALPAIARMLALSQGEVRATLRCDARDLGPLADDPCVSRCDDLLAALAAAPGVDGDSHVWFAADDQSARQARKLLVDRGLSKQQFTAAAYWSRG